MRPPKPALVICCKDYRYIQPIQRFVRQRLGIRWYNLKATAGGVLAMLDAPGIVRRWIVRDIALVYRLHGVRRVVIVHHEDCAAYGGTAVLGSVARQRAFHARQARRASAMLRRRFAGLTVRAYLAHGFPKTVRFSPL